MRTKRRARSRNPLPLVLAVAAIAATACGPERFYEGHRLDESMLAKVPWGVPVENVRAQQTVSEFLLGIARGEPQKALLAAAVPLRIGPSLWSSLLAGDAQMMKLGTTSVGIVHASAEFGAMHWEMRTFRTAPHVRALLGRPVLRSYASLLVGGVARPASPEEREVFYRLTPFEIRGRAVTVVEHGEQRLAVYLDGDHVSWMEILSGWSVKAAEPGVAAGPRELLMKGGLPMGELDPHPVGPENGGFWGR